MKKRVISFAVALVLMVSTLFVAMDASASGVTAQENGFTDVGFSNGFNGYCLDCTLDGAYTGKEYTISDTSAAKSNEGGADLSQTLKVLFTQCFTDLFESDGDGGYAISNTTNQNDLQFVIYYYTDPSQYSYLWGNKAALANKAEAYDGPEIPDSGYTLTLDNGDVILFDFMVMKTSDAGSQDFFAYKIEVNPTGAHTHDYGETWMTDEDKHWKECSCGDKTEEADHEEEVRNQVAPGEFTNGYTGDTYCEICDELLEEGTLVPATHEHDYSDDWKADEDKHWKECSCGDKTEEADHEEEVRNQAAPGEFTEGYTGDTYCEICDELLEEGSVIPATHEHDYNEEWSTDEDKHWHECECGDKKDEEDHEGEVRDRVPAGEFTEGYSGDIYCEICDEFMEEGEIIPPNHEHDYSEEWSNDEDKHWKECSCGDKTEEADHEEEVRNQVEPGEFTEGYTGDTYCEICDELLEEGSVIPATHEHEYSEEWSTDEDKHWHECECGDKKDEEEHEGGEATCVDKPICEECETPYGTKDPQNHIGGVEIRDAVEPTTEEPGYTGDAYCESCDELLEEGSVIPQLDPPTEDEETSTEDEEETTGEEEETTEEDTTSEEEKAPADKEESGPDTGDNTMIWTYLALVALSFAGCVIGFVRKRKTNI